MTANGSQPATECSHELPKIESWQDMVVELRLKIYRLGRQLDEIVRRDAASTTKLAQVRAILAGILAEHGIDVGDDPVRLAQQVRALVRALEAEVE